VQICTRRFYWVGRSRSIFARNRYQETLISCANLHLRLGTLKLAALPNPLRFNHDSFFGEKTGRLG